MLLPNDGVVATIVPVVVLLKVRVDTAPAVVAVEVVVAAVVFGRRLYCLRVLGALLSSMGVEAIEDGKVSGRSPRVTAVVLAVLSLSGSRRSSWREGRRGRTGSGAGDWVEPGVAVFMKEETGGRISSSSLRTNVLVVVLLLLLLLLLGK